MLNGLFGVFVSVLFCFLGIWVFAAFIELGKRIVNCHTRKHSNKQITLSKRLRKTLHNKLWILIPLLFVTGCSKTASVQNNYYCEPLYFHEKTINAMQSDELRDWYKYEQECIKLRELNDKKI